jgi:hypothetical protein
MESDGDGEEAVLEAAPEAPAPPDPWRFGGQAGVHVLDRPELVRQMCAILLAPAQLEQPGRQQQQQQQLVERPRYEFFGFHFDTVVLNSAVGVAAALPKGPTAAQRRDHAVHDRQSSGQSLAALGWHCCIPALKLLLHAEAQCVRCMGRRHLLTSVQRRGSSAVFVLQGARE